MKIATSMGIMAIMGIRMDLKLNITTTNTPMRDRVLTRL